MSSSHNANPCLSIWDATRRQKALDVKWKGTESDENADVYALTYSRRKDDFFVAGSIASGELQIFEKNIIYTPTWTAEGIHGGVTSCDLSPKDDRLAFTTKKGVHILNIGKII